MTMLLSLMMVMIVMRNRIQQIKRGQLWRRVTVVLMDWRRVLCIVVPLLCFLFTCIVLHNFAQFCIFFIAYGKHQFA